MQLFIKQPNNRYRELAPAEVMEMACDYVLGKASRDAVVVRAPADSEDILKQALAGLEAERFCAMFLDNRHKVIAVETLFTGTIDGTSVYPREVVKRALQLNAAAIIFAHNHPSGVPEPSTADERITRRLKDALHLVDIRVLDHIIVGGDKTVSLASRGML